jgi:ABC-type sugar transport system permease subunit/ABC-type glycerol-3-phosphate transport system substrate-binding protein
MPIGVFFGAMARPFRTLMAAVWGGLFTLVQAQEPTTIRMMAGAGFAIPPKESTNPRSIAMRAVFDAFHRQHPHIKVVNAGGLESTGPRMESMFLMSMAGDTSPDVFYVNFRQYYNYIDQGFCRPLDDLIAQNPGAADRVDPKVMEVLRSYDGKVYALPYFQVAQGLYFRKDYYLDAGLDPAKPPRTWEEFYEYGKKLTEAKPGVWAFAFSMGPAYHWSNFLWQAGGEVVEPAEGGYWKAAIATPEAARAVDFFRKLVTEKWVGKDGKTYGPVATVLTDFTTDVAAGKVAMWFTYTGDVLLSLSDVNPGLLGVAAMPAGPAGRANEINAGMWAINADVKDPRKLQACWEFLQFFAGEEAARVSTRSFVELGMANLVNPIMLRKFGYEDLVAQVDPVFVEANEKLFETGHPEPYGRNVQQVYVILDNALDRARLEPNTPAMTILEDISKEMDRKLLGYTPPKEMEKQRAVARLALGTVGLALAAFVFWTIYRSLKRRIREEERLPAGISRRRIYAFVLICLFPAAATLLVWAYYPLFKGLQIAFQDYRIGGDSEWVGVDNFIAVFTQPIFWRSLLNTFVYVALTIGIGFLLPIFLALALNEIPRAKVFFRTVFYLPAMTSGIVIAFLWRQFYDKTETGLLNTLLAPFIDLSNRFLGTEFPKALDWLGNPSLAMFAVVLPGIWAGAGPGSILYLAALKNIPDERYEAADMDGANWMQKIRWITIPGLKPLILINLLGVFIAGFKAMENIFVLTLGGPLYATHTIGLEVWTNAFMFLKFGYATAAAWVMGAILIGFTVIQIRNLLKMRFSTAKF